MEWNFQINAGATPQALEFDFPLWSAKKSFYFGTQCVPGSFWQYWIPGTTNHGWHNISQVACPAVQTGVWHKLRWYGTISGDTFTYSAMEIDGKQFAVNITVPAGSTTFADEFIVQFQFDGRGNGAGYTEYIDEVNAWIW